MCKLKKCSGSSATVQLNLGMPHSIRRISVSTIRHEAGNQPIKEIRKSRTDGVPAARPSPAALRRRSNPRQVHTAQAAVPLWVLFTRPSQNEACLRWESKISLGRRGDLAAETGQAAIGQQGMEVSGPLPDTAHLNDFYRVLAVPADSRTCVPWPRVHGTCASVLSFEHDRIG
jgi:hypothetical protein